LNTAFFKEFAAKYKNLVFIGEAGSGKTESALNMAQGFARSFKEDGVERRVHFFDMDQTKANLRARDAAAVLEESGVILHYGEQVLDAPTIAGGVIEHLRSPEAMVMMDIGGGSYGAHMIGQFADYLSGADTAVMYIFNPYRPWSISRDDVAETMAAVLGTGHLTISCLICNPNLGPATTVEEYMEGYRRMLAMFPETPISFCCAAEGIADEVETLTGLPVYPIKVTAPPEWLYDFD